MKINMKKNSYLCTEKREAILKKIRYMIMIAFGVTLPLTTLAQDLTRVIQGAKVDSLILRNYYPTNEWLLYNNHENYYFTFGKMNSTGTSFNFLNVQKNIDVKDMFVYRDTLFFCGRIFDSMTMVYKGLMGYFKINPMPTSSINYIMMDSLSCLNKIEVYKMASTLHMAVVGTHQTNYSVLVDAYMDNYFGNSTNWQVKWATISDMNAIFDDITITNSYVVASARVPDSTAAYLCFFEKTPLAYRSFLALNGNTIEKLLYYPFSRPVFLEHGDLDTLYAVYQNQGLLLPSLCICQFDGLQNTVSRSFSSSIADLTIKDVQRSYDYNSINILVSYSFRPGTMERFVTYNIPSAIMAIGGPVFARSYPASSVVYSLGGNKNGNQDAAGVCQTGEMGIFRTADNDIGSCAGLESVNLNPMSLISYWPIEKSLNIRVKNESVQGMTITTSPYSVYTSCQ